MHVLEGATEYSEWSLPGRLGQHMRAHAFIARLPREAVVFGPGYYTIDHRIYAEGMSHRQYNLGADIREHLTFAEPTKVDGVYIGGWNNWGHWLFQYLTKLAAVPLRAQGAVIVSDGLPETFYDCLSHLGISDIIRVKGPVSGDIWLPSPGAYRDLYGNCCIWPEALHYLRRGLVGFRDLRMRTRLYISREGAKWRRIVNEPQLIEALAQKGVMAIKLEEWPLEIQLGLLGRAELIVGGFGAGLASTMLAPPDCRIVAIGPRCMDGTMGCKLYADVLGQNYHRLYVDAGRDDNYEVNIDEILASL